MIVINSRQRYTRNGQNKIKLINIKFSAHIASKNIKLIKYF